jgi:hypothetical protein
MATTVHSTHVFRFARVPTTEFEARLGSEVGRIVNVSATGALLRINGPFQVGRSCPLFLNLPGAPISLIVRIVRMERLTKEPSTANAAQHLVGVMFTEFSATAKQAIARLCGAAFNAHD